MYAQVADIQEALDLSVLVHLVDDEREGLGNDGGLRPAQQARVAQKIRDAVAEADAYVGQRYRLPLPAVPTVLRAKVVDITLYHLFSRKQPPDEVTKNRWEAAIKFLQQVALGKASLPFPDEAGGSEGTAKPAGGAKIRSSQRRFTREDMGDY